VNDESPAKKTGDAAKVFPLWKRGIEGDLERVGALVTRKISPTPPFDEAQGMLFQRGKFVMRLELK
jgi:hypothetical protein